MITGDGEEPWPLDACFTLAYAFKCSPLQFYDLTFDELEDTARRADRMMRRLRKAQRDLE